VLIVVQPAPKGSNNIDQGEALDVREAQD